MAPRRTARPNAFAPRLLRAAALLALAFAGCDDDVPRRDPDFDGVRRPDAPIFGATNRAVVEDELERLAESLCRDQRGRPLEIIDFRWRECDGWTSGDNSESCVVWRAWCERPPQRTDEVLP